MNDFESRNEKQKNFSEIKGRITELNEHDNYPSITIVVGHENAREVNLSAKKERFDGIAKNHKIGDKVKIKYYLRSRNKDGRWFTTANILFVEKDSEI